MQHYKILGVKVTCAFMQEVHDEISRIIEHDSLGFVLSSNIHGINHACNDPRLRDFYNHADMVPIDGHGVIWGGKIRGYNFYERLTWADWVWPLTDYITEKKYRLFLLGGPEGLTDKVALRLQAHAPELNIVGMHHGYFKKHGPENDAVIHQINDAKPNIIWTGMGMPIQEKWIMDNYQKLNVNVYMTCGGAFKHMAGLLKRSPRLFINLHMEWLWLLLQNPKRGYKRYLYGNPVFIFNVLLEKYGLYRRENHSTI